MKSDWMIAFLGRSHGWGARTQAVGNCGGMPLSVFGIRPSKTIQISAVV